MVNYLHEISKITISTLSVMSVIAPIHALPIPSVHPSDDKHQEILDKFHSTKYVEKSLSKVMAKFPSNITLTLHQAKFPERSPGNSDGVKYPVEFLSG